jgi:phage baseplate assembly protein W
LSDLSHNFGGDLSISATGGLIVLASGTTLAQQRIIRRLLTNPGDYIWAPSYGAGLASFVGQPNAASRIRAVVLKNMKLEASVDQSKLIAVEVVTDPIKGATVVTVVYTDKITSETSKLTLPLGA